MRKLRVSLRGRIFQRAWLLGPLFGPFLGPVLTIGITQATAQVGVESGHRCPARFAGARAPSEIRRGAPDFPVSGNLPMPLPPLGERVATGAREVDGVYLYQGYPNYVVKVQTRDIDTKYTPEQVTSINRARSARKKVIQDALLSLPAGDRVPIARHAFGEGYFVQPFIRGGMELQEFQRLYPQAWERIREEYRRRMRMMTQRSTESMRRWFRETPDRPATHGDLLAGTAEPDVRAANFMVQIPPAGPNSVSVNHIVWVDW